MSLLGLKFPRDRRRRCIRRQSVMHLVPILLALWGIGFGVLVFSWWLRWRRISAAFREATPVHLAIGVPVLSSPSFIEPGVFGVFRPILLLPDGIATQLAPAELQAILAHELCHVRRRDNLATVMHMTVEAVFWFHPLVWWLGARLMEERERACDEEVVRMGSAPEAYAEGILKICELYLQSPLRCVAGVTGANLKKRIQAIMENRPSLRLSFAKKAGLAIAGVLAVAIPVILGVTNAPRLSAQADPNQGFEVVSVRRTEIPTSGREGPMLLPTGNIGRSGTHRMAYNGAELRSLISDALGVRFVIGPAWLDKERYDINVANISDGVTKEQLNVMMGKLLSDRFHLRFHIESRVVPIYALRVGKNGPKFKDTAPRADDPKAHPYGFDAQGFPIPPANHHGTLVHGNAGEMFVTAQDVSMAGLVNLIDDRPVGAGLGRPIIDETGLTGRYDFKIHYERPRTGTGVASDPAPSIFAAVEEQLGLKLESSTAPFDHLIIDSIDREPREN